MRDRAVCNTSYIHKLVLYHTRRLVRWLSLKTVSNRTVALPANHGRLAYSVLALRRFAMGAGGSKVQVYVRADKPFYYAGDVVTGSVVLHVAERTTFKQCSIKVSSQEKLLVIYHACVVLPSGLHANDCKKFCTRHVSAGIPYFRTGVVCGRCMR